MTGNNILQCRRLPFVWDVMQNTDIGDNCAPGAIFATDREAVETIGTSSPQSASDGA